MNWEGFLMGMSEFGVERVKEERAMKMKQQLLELQEKYAVAAEERAEAKALKRVDSQQTLEDFDPATGTGRVKKFNAAGELLSESAMSPGRIAEIRANEEKARLDNMNTQSQIDARKEELSQGWARVATDKERNALTRRGLEAAAASDSAPRTDSEIIENLTTEILNSYPLDKLNMSGGEGLQNMGRLRQLARQTVMSAVRAGDPAAAYDMFDRAVTTNNKWQSREPF